MMNFSADSHRLTNGIVVDTATVHHVRQKWSTKKRDQSAVTLIQRGKNETYRSCIMEAESKEARCRVTTLQEYMTSRFLSRFNA